MKLRIKGDSMRLRISPSEMSQLLQSGRIEETIRFGPDRNARLTYALMTQSAPGDALALRYEPPEIGVLIPAALARAWAGGEQIGVYGSIDSGAGQIEIAVEKDFACLEKSDAEDRDTYPNPNRGVIC